MLRSFSFQLSFVFALAVVLVGCAGTNSSTSPAQQAQVIGVWEYRAQGASGLSAGTFKIESRDGRLRGVLRDARRGRINMNVVQRGSRMELDLDLLRVSGRVEDNTFVGMYRRPQWDVSTSQNFRRTRGSSSGSIVARRVHNPAWSGAPLVSGCTPVLVETDYRCTNPLQN